MYSYQPYSGIFPTSPVEKKPPLPPLPPRIDSLKLQHLPPDLRRLADELLVEKFA